MPVIVRPDLPDRIAPVWRRRLFVAFVALLPLQTVFVSAWISWKPALALLIVMTVLDLVAGWQTRTWPWHTRLTGALGVFLVAVLVSLPGAGDPSRFLRLFLALVVGGLVLLITERSLRETGMGAVMLKTVFWSAAVMAVTAVVFGLMTVGAFGSGAVDAVGRLPLVFRIVKPAYLTGGFVALTNWHQDPGYAAAWMNLWAGLALIASWKGLGTRWWRADAAVVGALGYGVLMTMSRTGWLAMVATALVTAVFLLAAERVPIGAVLGRLASAGLIALVLVGVTWAVDRPGVGGDLGDQFGFRLRNLTELGQIDGDPLNPTPGPAYTIDDNRLDVWSRYLDLWRDHPLDGIGLGTGWDVQEPHNLVIELLAETGLVGLAGFAVLAAAIFVSGSGALGVTALVIALLPALSQTVLFEMSWWFAAGLFVARISVRGRSPAGVVPSG